MLYSNTVCKLLAINNFKKQHYEKNTLFSTSIGSYSIDFGD